MKATFRKAILSLIVCLAASTASAWGQDSAGRAQVSGTLPPPNAPSETIVAPPNSAGYAVAVPFGPQLGFDGYFGDGTGYKGNYYQMNAFLPMHLTPGKDLFFGTFQGGASEQGDAVVNLGGAYRMHSAFLDRIFTFGGNLDIDDAGYKTRVRGGFSFESLGQYFDFRTNAYMMFGDESHTVSDSIISQPFFSQNNIMFDRQKVTENVYSGGDAEVGGPIPYLGRYGINGYLGGYYLYSPDDEAALGVKVRVQAHVNDDVDVGATYTNDGVFGSNAWANVSINLPQGRPTNWFKGRKVKDRLDERIVRFNRVHRNMKYETSVEAAINPNDGFAYEVYHVNPDAGTNGIGTYESPFNSLEAARLANAANIDIIRVMPGNATNLTVTAPFQLLDNQRLLSSSVSHIFTATQGTFILPSWTGGTNPVISNSAVASSVVHLANNNEVSGFTIDGTDGDGDITNTGISNAGGLYPSINGFDINRNTFQNYVRGVDIANASGSSAAGTDGRLTENTFTGTVGTSIDGFRLQNVNTGPLDLTVAFNTATGNQGILPTFEGNGFLVVADNSVINANSPFGTFSNNIATTNGTGFSNQAINGGTYNIDFDDNVATGNVAGNTGAAFLAANTGGGDSLMNITSFSGNNISDNVGTNITFTSTNSGGGTSELRVRNFVNNTITGSGTGNTSGVATHGLSVQISGANSLVDMVIGDPLGQQPQNVFSGNGAGPVSGIGLGGGHNLNIVATTGGTVQGAIVNNQFIDTTSTTSGHGVSIRGGLGTTIDFGSIASRQIAGNTFTGLSGTGLFFESTGSIATTASTSYLNVRNNIFGTTDNPNQGPGLHATAQGINNTMNITVGGPALADVNFFDSNGDAGIWISTRESAVGNIVVQHNRIVNTTDNAANSGLLDGQGDGILLTRESNSTMNAVVGNAAAVNSLGNVSMDNEGAGFRLYAIGGSSIQTNIQMNANLFDSNENGVLMDLGADAVVVVNAAYNVFRNNSIDGLWLTTRNNSSFGNAVTDTFSVFDGNTFITNGVDNIHFSAEDSSYQQILVSGNVQRTQLFGGGNMGILLESSSGGGAVPQSQWTIQGTDIDMLTGGVDGININNSGSVGTIVNIGGAATGEYVTVQRAGDDGLEAVYTNGYNILNIVGNATPGLVDPGFTGTSPFDGMTAFFNNGHQTGSGNTDATRGDGISILQGMNGETQIAELEVTILGTASEYNRGRGLNIDVTAEARFTDRDAPDAAVTGPPYVPLEPITASLNGTRFFTPVSIFNIGTYTQGDDGLNVQNRNSFSNNGLQGISIRTLALNNIDNQYLNYQTVQGPNQSVSPFNQSFNSPDLVTTNIRVENNVIQGNGTISNADGLILQVGTNTLMNATVNANAFGGNTLNDFNAISVVSLQPNVFSINDVLFDPVPDPDILRDYVAGDPVSHLNLVWGAFSSVGGNTPDLSRNLANDPGSSFDPRNTGERVAMSEFGDPIAVAGSNVTGFFNSADAFKPTQRFSVLSSNVWSNTLINPGSNFVNSVGVTQNVQQTFSNAGATIQALGTPFPFFVLP